MQTPKNTLRDSKRPKPVASSISTETASAAGAGTPEDDCCDRVTIAAFRDSQLLAVGERHTGPFCAGIVNALVISAWLRGEFRRAPTMFPKAVGA